MLIPKRKPLTNTKKQLSLSFTKKRKERKENRSRS